MRSQKHTQSKRFPRDPVNQRGATLIEFTVILLPLITLIYGIVVYSIVFVTQQAVAYAAESGAEAVVAVDPSNSAYDSLAAEQATQRVNSLLTFLPGGQSVCLGTQNGNRGCSNQCFDLQDGLGNPSRRQCTVQVTYNFGQWGFLVKGLLPVPTLITGVGLVNTQLPPAS